MLLFLFNSSKVSTCGIHGIKITGPNPSISAFHQAIDDDPEQRKSTNITLFQCTIEKLIANANEAVLILGFFDAPQTFLAPFWEYVHKEERINLPGITDLMNVLWELGYYPDLEVLSIDTSPTFESMENAIDDLRNRLYVTPGTEKDFLLKNAAAKLLIDTDDGLSVSGSKSRVLGLVRINTC